MLLDAPVDVARKRAGARGAPDRIETEQNEFFERARACYLELAETEPDRFVVIDATAELDAVQAAARAAVTALLDNN